MEFPKNIYKKSATIEKFHAIHVEYDVLKLFAVFLGGGVVGIVHFFNRKMTKTCSSIQKWLDLMKISMASDLLATDSPQR